MIEEVWGRRADVTLVLEPSAHGAVKTARKGTGILPRSTATGRRVARGARAAGRGRASITALVGVRGSLLAAKVAAAATGARRINTGALQGRFG